MAARGRIPAGLEGHSVQAPGMRHGPFPGLSSAAGHRSLESLPHPQLLESKLAAQETEVERLSGDNHRLANTHVVLREALVAATQDVQKIKSQIRSIQTESDIQIKVLLDKIAKSDFDIRAGDGVRKELQQAHIEAQRLAAAREELSVKLQRATQELKKARSDVQSMPDLQAELDSLVQEHHSLRSKFEYEKNKNLELVEEMKAKEKNLISMAKEVEMLRAEISNAEKRVKDSNGPFVDSYGRAHGQMAFGQVGESMPPYGDSNGVAAVNVSGGGGGFWAGPYDPSGARR